MPVSALSWLTMKQRLMMKTENRIASYLPDAERAFEPVEAKEYVGIEEDRSAPPGAFCWQYGSQVKATTFGSSAWIGDLRKISTGQGMVLRLHLGAEPTEDISALRQECDALRQDYGDMRDTIEVLKGTLDRLRELLEGNT